MDMRITPHVLSGSVDAIASKSMAHRLLLLAALGSSPCEVACPTTSADIDATISCLEALGAHVSRGERGFVVTPLGGAREHAALDCGESGSTLRFMLPVLAALGRGGSLSVRGRLSQRPLSPLREELEAHGCMLTEAGVWPLEVSGQLAGGTFHLPGNVSSQYVSGLLMAAPLLGEDVRVVVREPFESSSYVGLTIGALKAFGVAVETQRGEEGGVPCTCYRASGDQRICSPARCVVEGDWSNAAFWLAAGALGAGVSVRGLDLASAQGDRACVAVLAALGARITRGEAGVSCDASPLTAATIDVSDIPDLVPPLAAVATQARGTTRIVGAARLRLKESDRLETVRAGLCALGAHVDVEGDSLVIEGGTPLSGGTVDAANDHRIAMMAAIAGATATGPTTILGAQCVSKSYPTFFADFRALGGIAEECEA